MDDLETEDFRVSGVVDEDGDIEISLSTEPFRSNGFLDRKDSIKFIEHIAEVHGINIRELAI